jgi:hypothetical protein
MLKILCKRTHFRVNTNFFKINGMNYGEKYVAFKKNKIYNYRKALKYEEKLGIVMYVESERENYWLPITSLVYQTYFIDIYKARDKKINEVLK